MPIYRRILSNSWKMTWRNKYLWFFGLFASVLAGKGVFEILSSALSGGTSGDFLQGVRAYSETGIFRSDILSRVAYIATHDTVTAIVFLFLFLLLLLLFCFVVWLSMVSQSALVNSTAKITSDKTTDFQDAVNMGISKFWPVFGVNLLLQVVSFVVLFIIGLPTLFAQSGASQFVTNLVFIVCFLVFVPFLIALSFAGKYAICFIVIKGEKFKKSVGMALRFFMKNWLVSLEMAFVLFAIGFLVTFAVFLAILVAAVPFAFLIYLFAVVDSIFFFWLFLGVSLFLLFAIIVISGSIFTAFQISVITNLFIELLNRGGESKLVRIFNKG